MFDRYPVITSWDGNVPARAGVSQSPLANVHFQRVDPAILHIADVESTEFQPQLRLENSHGDLVAKSHRCGRVAYLSWLPERAETFRLVVTPGPGAKIGSYVLHVRAVRAVDPVTTAKNRRPGDDRTSRATAAENHARPDNDLDMLFLVTTLKEFFDQHDLLNRTLRGEIVGEWFPSGENPLIAEELTNLSLHAEVGGQSTPA